MTSFQKHISEDLAFKETIIKIADRLCEPKKMVTNMAPFFTCGKNERSEDRGDICLLLLSCQFSST